MKIKEMTGMNCVGLNNPAVYNAGLPEEIIVKNKVLKITKVEVSSDMQVEVGLLMGDLEVVNPEQIINSFIRNSDLGSPDMCKALACLEPSLLEPVVLLKSASIADGQSRKLIDNSDFLLLPPGKSLAVRAVPSRIMQVIHITIVFDEKESDIL